MKDKSHTVSVNKVASKSISHSTLDETVKTLAGSFGLEYSKPPKDDSNHWYGTISPIICFLNLFKTRINERRVGHGAFTTKKKDGTSFNVSVSQYGFYPAHHIMLEGITLTPERKSGMAQSLGPLTALISLAKSDPDNKYSKRWKMAVQRNCSFLPEIDSIVQVCCGKKASEVSEIFNIIADILLMTTSREAKRASFPAFMLIKLLDDNEVKHYEENNTRFTAVTDIAWFNFSGNGAFQLYNRICSSKWSYNIKETKKQYLNQIIFHAIWGTYCNDFGILAWMTNQKDWATRNTLDDAFKQLGNQPPQEFTPVKINKYSKLTSANQTGLLSVTSSQVDTRSLFSGESSHVFQDKFFEYIMSTRATGVAVKKNMETLTNILQNVKSDLFMKIKDNRVQKRGTTAWHLMEGSNLTEYGPVIKEVPATSGQCFMQAME